MTTSTKSLLILSSLLQLAFSLETKAIAKDSTEKKVEVKETILDTVDIGNDDFFTPFILNGTSEFGDEDAAVKEQIDTRDFASDEFYMRNIDREEFEQGSQLLRRPLLWITQLWTSK